MTPATSVLVRTPPPSAPPTAGVRRRHAAPHTRHPLPPVPARDGPARFGFRPELEGLRAIAVLAVVLYHAGVPFLPGGFVGVDVFFVLSGYLITGLMLAEVARSGRLSLSRFYARRIRRLLPAATLVLCVTAAVSAWLLPPLLRGQAAGDILASALYVSNWRFAAQSTDYLQADSEPSPVLHFWSLGIEEQFYVLWPLLIVLALALLPWLAARGWRRQRVFGATIGAVLVLSFAGGALLTSGNEPLAFFSTFTRIWELAAGAVVAVIGARVLVLTHKARAGLAWLGILALGLVILTYDEEVAYPGWAAGLPVLATVAVIAGCTARPGRTAPGPGLPLSAGPLRHVGRISYSWYLWHWPVLVIPALAMGTPLTWWQATLAVAVSYLLSLWSFRFVEDPMRYARALQGVRPALALGVALTLVSAVAAYGLARSGDESAEATGVTGQTEQLAPGVYEAAPDVELNVDTGKVTTPVKLTPSPAEADGDHFAELYDNGCQATLSSTRVVDCVMGKKTGKRTMVVIGDSHAAAYAPALDIVALDRGWKMVPMTKAGCSPAYFSVRNPQFERAYTECDQWRQTMMAKVKALHPDLVVVTTRWAYDVAGPDGGSVSDQAARDAAMTAGWTKLARTLQSYGAKVVYLRDVLYPGFNGPVCISKHLTDFDACSFAKADNLPQDGAAMAGLAKAGGVQVVDLTDSVCPTDICQVAQDNILRYRDSNHMTATYARTLAPELLTALPAQL